MSFTLDDVIEKATLPERVVHICVAGALSAEYDQLREEVIDIPMGRLGGSGRRQELLERIAELEPEIAAATFPFRFRALEPKQWSDLLAKHPDPSKQRIFDNDAFPPAAIAACCIEPAGMDDPEKVAALMTKLSSAQQDELFNGAWTVNNNAPKGLTSSPESEDPKASGKN